MTGTSTRQQRTLVRHRWNSPLPTLEQGFLYPNQVEAVTNLEHSLKRNPSRSLAQTATASGRTIFAITLVYIKYAGARRVLF